MIRRQLLYLFCLMILQSGHLVSQEATDRAELRIQFDSRSTLVSKETVGIFGLRAGLLMKKKYEIGIGIYASRVFDFFGKEVEKDYLDTSISPSQVLPATIGFKYVSLYGEYTLVNNKRWVLTANSQYGMGRVQIELAENGLTRKKTERKSLIEHSLKAKYQFNSWLQLIGGVGYRYLLGGEKQVRDAFNAPIFIVSTEIDFRTLFKNIKGK